jgi:hypothetical protein
MPDPNAGRFVWYDLMTNDPQAAEAFYTDVLGWGTEVFTGAGTPYTMWKAGEQMIGGIGPMPAGTATPPHWLGYVDVEDVDATVRRAEELGDKTHHAPEDIPTVGRFAVLEDPQGAFFAIYQSLNPAAEAAGEPKVGEVSWNELATTDAEAAWSFYTELFGWQKTDDFDMGDGWLYHMFGYGGPSMGAVYRKPPEMPGPPAWTYYVLVEDLDGKIAKVNERGGRVLTGAMEVPGGDRVAVCADPQGAVFAMHEKKAS